MRSVVLLLRVFGLLGFESFFVYVAWFSCFRSFRDFGAPVLGCQVASLVRNEVLSVWFWD